MNTKTTIIIIVAIIFAVTFFILSGRKTTHAPQIVQPSATINGHTFSIELAKDDKTRERGLSYRASLPEDQGLLFLFDKPSTYSFWMKEMHFPIDIIYIDNDTIVHVFENVPPPTSPKQELPVYTPDTPADKVLEINAGLSKKYRIKKGDKIKFNL
jgi:uncharacterized protein